MKHNTQYTGSHEILMCGIALLSIPFLSLVLATITLLVGGCISAWMFPAALVISVGCGHAYLHSVHDSKHSVWRYYLFTLLALVFSLFTSALLYDNSYDGNTYHQGAVVAMLNGWNPIYNPTQTGSLWEAHYAKSLEIVATTISICTHRIETGKAVNILLILSSVFITFHFLRNELPRHSTKKILLLTILLTSCPVVVRQAYIYYNDFALYTFMLLSVLALIQIGRDSRNKQAWYILIVVVLFATVTKFTIAFYTFLTLAIGIVWLYVIGQRSLCYRLIATSVVLFVVGFGILGYHPYITNTLGWGNPFYPLMGSNVDIMTINTPELFNDGNRVTNWICSLFYNAEGTGVWIPILNDSLHDYYIAYDARIAGLGALFVYALIIAICVFIWVAYKNRYKETKSHYRNTIAVISTLLILGCFIFEQSWWMRYVPFLWAVPVVLLLYTEVLDNLSQTIITWRKVIYIMLTATVIMCCAATFIGGIAFTQRLGSIYHAITPQSTVEMYSYENIVSFEHKLNERNISFRRLEKEEQPSDSTLICVPFPEKANLYLDPETYSRLPHPDLIDYMSSKK